MSHTNIQHLVDEHKRQLQGSVTISSSKEGEPIEIAPEKKSQPDIEITETEPKVEDREVEKYVKVEKKHKVELDPSLKEAGLSAIYTISLDSRHKVNLPISDAKILEGHEQPVTSAWRWLAEFCIYLLRKAHLTLKKVHGHVVRIMVK